MLINEFQLLLEIRSIDGRVLGQRRVEPNWEPACEAARFACWRKTPGSVAAFSADAVIEPIAQQSNGLPLAIGFSVTLMADGKPLDRCEFPVTYPGFTARAHAISSEMVTAGLLKDGETFRYQLLAFPRERANGRQPAQPLFNVVDVVRAPPLKPASFATLMSAAVPFGELTAGDMPVFIPQQILDEASALTRQADRVETGGILVGHLCVDGSIPEIAVHVTAQIPARYAAGEVGKLTFTAETWAAVQAALALRRSDEIMVGWFHSHPAFAWCEKSAQCPSERSRGCALMQSFFSADDVFLHETVYPSAYNIALVVTNTNNTGDGLKHALFGWRQGTVRQRGFHILNPDRSWKPVNATVQGGKTYATPPCK